MEHELPTKFAASLADYQNATHALSAAGPLTDEAADVLLDRRIASDMSLMRAGAVSPSTARVLLELALARMIEASDYAARELTPAMLDETDRTRIEDRIDIGLLIAARDALAIDSPATANADLSPSFAIALAAFREADRALSAPVGEDADWERHYQSCARGFVSAIRSAATLSDARELARIAFERASRNGEFTRQAVENADRECDGLLDTAALAALVRVLGADPFANLQS